jgi:AraC family transcriptional regulator
MAGADRVWPCEAGHIRAIRCVFSADTASRVMALKPAPELTFLQAMLSLNNDVLHNHMGHLRRELENVQSRSDTAAAALIELIGIELERIILREAAPSLSGRLTPWQFRRIRERLTMPGTAPGVAELAALCGISPRHRHRQFQALTGRTVAAYIEAIRIEEAKAMLERGRKPIKTISQACGFAHPNSFTRAFRRSTSLTPLAFCQAAGTRNPQTATH